MKNFLGKLVCFTMSIAMTLAVGSVKTVLVHASEESGASTVAAGDRQILIVKEDGTVWYWDREQILKYDDSVTKRKENTIKDMKEQKDTADIKDLMVVVKNFEYGRNYAGTEFHGIEWLDFDLMTLEKISGLENIKAVSSGSAHFMAIKEDGSLWGWGNYRDGQLGEWSTNNVSLEDMRKYPTRIMENVKAVSLGRAHSLAIKEDGSLWAWGNNESGQLGDGSTSSRDNPVKIMDEVKAISAGYTYSMAIKEDGSLWAWGNNDKRQLGDNTKTDRTSPVKIMDKVKDVSAGTTHTMAIQEDGSLWAWGNNNSGELGDGTKEYKAMPVKVMEGVKSVSTGFDFTLALKEDGSLWAWGKNYYSTFAKEDPAYDKSTPMKIMEGVRTVAAGINYTLITKEDGNLYVWGEKKLGHGGAIDLWSKDTEPLKIRDITNLPTDMLAKLQKKTEQIDDVPKSGPSSQLSSGLSEEDLKAVIDGVKDKEIVVTFNGTPLKLTLPIINRYGRAMYPFRELLESMEAKVEWDSVTRTAKGTVNQNVVEFQMGSNSYKANGEIKNMDTGVVTFIEEGRTYIPIRYAVEGLGLILDWDEATNTIIINTK